MELALFTDYSLWQLVSAMGILVVASIVRGLTGFGFSALVVTGLGFIFLPTEVVVMALILEIVASVHLLPSVWKDIDWSLLASLMVGVVVATPVGMYLLNWLQPDLMRLLISVTVLSFATIIAVGFSRKGEGNYLVHGGLGLISGLCNGAAALGGLPIVAFMLSGKTSVKSVRATLVATFFATDVYAMLFAGGHGIVGTNSLLLAACALPILFAGVGIGKRLFHLAPPQLFRRVSLALLIFISIVGGAKALVNYI